MTAPDDTIFHLKGDLTATQVAVIHRHSRTACRNGQIPERIDLARVTRTDSSALGLLLEWQSCAHRHGRSIEFTNPPESLQVLAGLSQIDELLGWNAGLNSNESEDMQ